MPRGGRRAGKPGVGYAQRTDLNIVRKQTVPGQQYGQQAAQQAAMSAVPMGTPVAPSPAGGTGAAPAAPPPPLTPLSAASARPDEPVTAGLPLGPGPGPEVLGADVEMDELRALYLAYPSEELREIIEALES